MPIQGQRHPFTEAGIADSPKDPGVFVLWDRDEAIYIGRTAGPEQTIHAALAEHCRGAYGNCTQFATHYGFEATPHPAPREQALMEKFGSMHGRLPRCQNVTRRRG
jgi:hypothetical protein